jgi:hypothetical protein
MQRDAAVLPHDPFKRRKNPIELDPEMCLLERLSPRALGKCLARHQFPARTNPLSLPESASFAAMPHKQYSTFPVYYDRAYRQHDSFSVHSQLNRKDAKRAKNQLIEEYLGKPPL